MTEQRVYIVGSTRDRYFASKNRAQAYYQKMRAEAMAPFLDMIRQPTFVVGREDVELDSVDHILAQHADHHDQLIRWPDLWFGASNAHLYSVNRHPHITHWNDFLHAVQRVQASIRLSDGEVSALWQVAKQHADLLQFPVQLYSVQPLGEEDDEQANTDRATPVGDSDDGEDTSLLS